MRRAIRGLQQRFRRHRHEWRRRGHPPAVERLEPRSLLSF
jgi:hypothetical protein